jgi:hypothetical protein
MGRPPFPGAVPGVGIRGVPAGLPVSKQVLNTVPSRTVYVSNLNEKVKLNGNVLRCIPLIFYLHSLL